MTGHLPCYLRSQALRATAADLLAYLRQGEQGPGAVGVTPLPSNVRAELEARVADALGQEPAATEQASGRLHGRGPLCPFSSARMLGSAPPAGPFAGRQGCQERHRGALLVNRADGGGLPGAVDTETLGRRGATADWRGLWPAPF